MATFDLLELVLVSSVAPDALKAVSVALERLCGPPEELNMLETVLVCNRAEARIQWRPGASLAALLVHGPALKTSAPPNKRVALAEVTARPLCESERCAMLPSCVWLPSRRSPAPVLTSRR